MPYFLYKVRSGKRLESVDSWDQYKEAKAHAKSMRQDMRPEDDYAVRIIFAKNSEEAERLLTEKREPRPMGEE